MTWCSAPSWWRECRSFDESRWERWIRLACTDIEGGTTEGISACEWRGNELLGRNEAVGGHYVIGFRERPEQAATDVALAGDRVLLWHCNYHPDSGQLFFPLDGTPFVVPFFDKQGRVHARVSCDLAGELGVLLNVPLPTGPLPPS